MKITVDVDGCDDTTVLRMDIPEDQVEALREFAERVSAVASGCQPRMSVETGWRECDDLEWDGGTHRWMPMFDKEDRP